MRRPFLSLLCIAVMSVATTASAATLYRIVTDDGRVIYSDTPGVSDSNSKPSQIRVISTVMPIADKGTTANQRDEPAGKGSIASCTVDTKKYCASSNGQKAAFDCLLDHQNDVSDACYNALKKRIESEKEQPAEQDEDATAQDSKPARDTNPPPGPNPKGGIPGAMSCWQDLQQFCKGVKPGGGRLINCLMGHQNDISQACYDALAKKTQNSNP